jgi:hypothetical protein
VVANEAGNIGIVFDDEDAWFHGFYCNEASCEYLAPSGESGASTTIFIGL